MSDETQHEHFGTHHSSLITHDLQLEAREVLVRFAVQVGLGELEALGNRGGFSGARLWRVATSSGLLCLRAWPPGQPSEERLAAIHRWMHLARAAGLEFVPRLQATPAGA